MTSFTTTTLIATTYPTTTIPTSAGFTPLASVVAAQGYSSSKKKRHFPGVPQDRAADAGMIEADAAVKARAAAASMSKRDTSAVQSTYPSAVSCLRLVEVVSTSTIISTAKITSTVTAAPGTITTVRAPLCSFRRRWANGAPTGVENDSDNNLHDAARSCLEYNNYSDDDHGLKYSDRILNDNFDWDIGVHDLRSTGHVLCRLRYQ